MEFPLEDLETANGKRMSGKPSCCHGNLTLAKRMEGMDGFKCVCQQFKHT